MENMKQSESEFDRWWNFGGAVSGAGIAVSVLTIPDEERRAEAVRLLCRIAYFKGRVDEGNKAIRQLEARQRQGS